MFLSLPQIFINIVVMKSALKISLSSFIIALYKSLLEGKFHKQVIGIDTGGEHKETN